MKFNDAELPITIATLSRDLSDLGVSSGMTILVDSSLSAMKRYIVGGAPTVVLALEQLIGEQGTLVMPTHTTDLSDPAMWQKPPVPESWWSIIREEMPAFQPDLTPTYGMGAIVECFRKQTETIRSNHPQVSFAARGPEASTIVANHSLSYGLGEQSPLARIYDGEGWVLLLGVQYDKNTSLHLAEYRARYTSKSEAKQGAPVRNNGRGEWTEYDDINYDSEDFVAIGEAFERNTDFVRTSKIGEAVVRLMPQRQLVDYAIRWMEKHRE